MWHLVLLSKSIILSLPIYPPLLNAIYYSSPVLDNTNYYPLFIPRYEGELNEVGPTIFFSFFSEMKHTCRRIYHYFFHEKCRKSFCIESIGNSIFSLVTNFHNAFIYLFFSWKKFMLFRIRLPLKLYHSPFYQFCVLLEHHLVDKFPSILFSCQILISFRGAHIHCSFHPNSVLFSLSVVYQK